MTIIAVAFIALLALMNAVSVYVRATRLRAALAGVWSVIGMGSLDLWQRGHALDVTTSNFVFFAVAIVFLIVPGYLFVIGPEKPPGLMDYFTREYWINSAQVGIRAVCWFLGGIAFFLPAWALLKWLSVI